jgi:hypothetical protein
MIGARHLARSPPLGSPYELAQPVSRARVLGMADERIAAMRGHAGGRGWLIARAVDALFDERRLPPALEVELASALGRRGVIDLIATVGFYPVLGSLLMWMTRISTPCPSRWVTHER